MKPPEDCDVYELRIDSSDPNIYAGPRPTNKPRDIFYVGVKKTWRITFGPDLPGKHGTHMFRIYEKKGGKLIAAYPCITSLRRLDVEGVGAETVALMRQQIEASQERVGGALAITEAAWGDQTRKANLRKENNVQGKDQDVPV